LKIDRVFISELLTNRDYLNLSEYYKHLEGPFTLIIIGGGLRHLEQKRTTLGDNQIVYHIKGFLF